MCAGTGVSNRCISVFDCFQQKKVAEYINPGPGFGPHKCAEMAFAMGRWFVDTAGLEAYICWEHQGPGLAFWQRMKELGYRNFFIRRKAGTNDEFSQAVGWVSTGGSKPLVLTEYARALAAGDYQNPSARAIDECGQYRYFEGGRIGHVKAFNPEDPSGARDQHGDIVIADMLSWLAAGDIRNESQEIERRAPIGSAMYRRNKRLAQEKGKKKLEGRWHDGTASRWNRYGRVKVA